MIRKGLKPGFKFGIELPTGGGGSRRALPFRRSWVAIAILAGVNFIFLIPLFGAFSKAASGWGRFDSLFDLGITIFLSAWMLGWSIAPVIMTLILLIMLFGREVIRARPGFVTLFTGLPGIGLTAVYDVSKMRNLRLEEPGEKSGDSWRGSHLAFDYGANPIHFGSAIDHQTMQELKYEIEAASESLIRSGKARPEDLRPNWETEEEEPARPAVEEAVFEQEPVSLASASAIALIIANLIPVAGTVFLGWNLGDVMVLYWAESAVIGFFNLLKIIVIGRWGALIFGPFFVGHFSGFMAIHLIFVYSIFVVGVQGDMDSGGDLAKVSKPFIALWPALAALFLSHGYSFVTNFIGRQEYRGKTMSTQMAEPYSRVIFMHMVLIFGGGLALFLQQPAPVILIVIAIKAYMDLKAHIKERAGRTPEKKP